jgi:hypothetical protein
MPWANYKRVASATNKDGDIVTGTVCHQSFICVGDTSTSAMCFYVNKRLSHCSLVLEQATGLEADSTLILNLSVSSNGVHIRLMNVYNHPKDMKAVRAIIDNKDMLSCLDLCIGDFNMHHSLWDSQDINNRPSALA